MEGVEGEEEGEEERGTVVLWRRVLDERDDAAGLGLGLLSSRRGGSMVLVGEGVGGRLLPRQMLCKEEGRSRTRALTVVGKEDRTQRKETRAVKQERLDLELA